MKIKQTIRNLVLGGLLLVPLFAGVVATIPAYAACGGVDTAIINCDEKGGDDAKIEDTGLWGLLLIAINILVAGVGILALGGIVYGAILYTSAGGNPEQVKKARSIFTNVVIGVVAFAGMYALFNFLIPGGVFTK